MEPDHGAARGAAKGHQGGGKEGEKVEAKIFKLNR